MRRAHLSTFFNLNFTRDKKMFEELPPRTAAAYALLPLICAPSAQRDLEPEVSRRLQRQIIGTCTCG